MRQNIFYYISGRCGEFREASQVAVQPSADHHVSDGQPKGVHLHRQTVALCTTLPRMELKFGNLLAFTKNFPYYSRKICLKSAQLILKLRSIFLLSLSDHDNQGVTMELTNCVQCSKLNSIS